MDGLPFNATAGHLVASNGAIHDEMLAIIREFRSASARES
jgi:hypothetical protein